MKLVKGKIVMTESELRSLVAPLYEYQAGGVKFRPEEIRSIRKGLKLLDILEKI